MKKYFTTEQLNYLHGIKTKFENIKSSKDVAEIFAQKNNMIRAVYDALDKHDPNRYMTEKWKFLNAFLPGLCVNEGAEGIMIADFSLVPLSEKAKQTPEKDDDLFFEAISDGGNTYTGANEIIHFEETRLRYCYHDLEPCYSELGSGKVYNALKQIDKALVANGNFEEELKRMKEYVIQPLKQIKYFGYSKEETQKYLRKIIAEIKIEGELQEDFNKAIEHISLLPDDRFNCDENWKESVPSN